MFQENFCQDGKEWGINWFLLILVEKKSESCCLFDI